MTAEQMIGNQKDNLKEKDVPEFKPLPDERSINSERSVEDEIKENFSSDAKSEFQKHSIGEVTVKPDEINVSNDLIHPRIITEQSQYELSPYQIGRKRNNDLDSRGVELLKVIKRQHHVMNAPKEYYPANYDKNFDDNFDTKIDLPLTSFHCGDQKHFPGLYSDMELNCMVFHVCALTEEGLIMKSFLCPESTVFDQSILKCNWWFYTDCKNSQSLYDSNLPVAKSYQLMKSLFYFNNHYSNKKPKKLNIKKQEIVDSINSTNSITSHNITT